MIAEPRSAEMPQISIVIPTYRRQAWLAALLQALAAQRATLPAARQGAVEVLVVDNCPEGSARDTVIEAPGLRYLREAAKGVANARNAGVAAARGRHVLFIDDDEIPAPGWLAAFLALADSGAEAAFGPIEPRYEAPPPADLAPILDRLFSRRMAAADGADISGLRAYLGSGNSMFDRARCLSGPEPFDPRFNGGGEDVWLLRRLVEDEGVILRWCAGGRVEEIVPADRMTEAFLRRRRFRDGQLRCIVDAGAGGWRGRARTGFWMAAGLAQMLGHRALAMLGRDPVAARIRAEGGRGKLLWWRT